MQINVGSEWRLIALLRHRELGESSDEEVRFTKEDGPGSFREFLGGFGGLQATEAATLGAAL